MITSAENYPKTPSQKKIMDRENPRTNGKSDAIQRKSHTVAYAYTLTKREKGKKYIYIVAPKVHLLNLGCFVFY